MNAGAATDLSVAALKEMFSLDCMQLETRMLWISCQHKYRVYLEAFGSGHKTILRGNSFTVLHLQFLKETAVHAKQQWNNVKGFGSLKTKHMEAYV